MPVQMAPHQLAFWAELLSPFPPELLSTTRRGGKELTYVDKRAISNRLDSVCGPDGWYPEYEATARGYKCRLFIRVPMATPGTAVFMHKEDGAGFEEMGQKNKETGEFEYDVDNDEKSGYTNAFRRAGQDAWGIGRYLYKKGIPSFLDPNAKPVEFAYQAESTPVRPIDEPMPTKLRTAPVPVTPAQAAPAPAPAKQFDNFKIPRAGKQVYPWSKEMEKTFETNLFNGMVREGETNGWGKQFAEWNQEQVDAICMNAIAFIRELPTYQGQYEHLFPGGVAPAKTGEKPGVNIADLRKSLLEKMKALTAKKVGREPTNVELKSAFETIASSSVNSAGNTGEVPESLSKMTDVVWLGNMLTLVDSQIAQAVALPEGDEIPF